MVSKLLLTIQLCPKTEFQLSERFGEDLSDSTWEYIFAIELLCCYQKWVWTHDNIIRYRAVDCKVNCRQLVNCSLSHLFHLRAVQQKH